MLPPLFQRELVTLLGGDRVAFDAERMLVYEADALAHFTRRPAAVTWPRGTDEVAAILRLAARHGVIVTPRGAGTGLSGGAVPSAPAAVVIETARMDRILAIDVEDRRALVEPGVVNAAVSRAAAAHGLRFSPDPSSQMVCTIGGNAAENAGGPHGFKHGSTVRHVAGATLVLEGGEVVELGELGRGEDDLLALVVGSEGTLGVITRLLLKLDPLPEASATLLASFRDLESACGAVADLVAEGVEAAAVEAIDRLTIEAVEASVFAAGYPEDAGAVLLVDLEGHAADVEDDVARLRAIFARRAMLAFEEARDPVARKLLWRGRKGAFGAMGRVAPNLYVMDAVVPRSRLVEAVAGVTAICARHRLRLANVLHAGDGNLHPNVSYDARDADELRRVHEANDEIVRLCLALGGTLTGEHGVGIEKRELIGLVLGPDDLALQGALRRAFAPRGLVNPDKVLPMPGACTEVGPARRRIADAGAAR